MVQSPELAAEVTLQPMRRFALDAAIIFSDILVIPKAMGIPYSFREQGGIQMEHRIDSAQDIDKLSTENIPEKLQYVADALTLARRELGNEKALLGFGGSPWTLATYMIEGGSSKNFTRSKYLLHSAPALFHQLLEKITAATIDYFEMQIQAGVDAIQIFDSWGGVLSYDTFWDASAQYMARIIESVQHRVPIIVYSKGAHHWSNDLKRTDADVLGLDWSISLADFHDSLGGNIAVQGNLDPVYMSITPDIVREQTLRILTEFGDRKGLIFNLGHGIHPDGKIECMEALVDTVTSFNIQRSALKE
jgi:uroporphyrinogen decarboxylase